MREKSFERFLGDKTAKRITPDRSRAEFLVRVSEKSYASLQKSLSKIKIGDENANDYVKTCYDIFMGLIRAKMLLDGYKASGLGAHEAEITYMRNLKFNEGEIKFADQVRYFRNGILYYGTLLDKEYAEKVLEFLNRVYPRLKRLVENK